VHRRNFLGTLAGSVALGANLSAAQIDNPLPKRDRLKQGVTRSVFAPDSTLEDCCRESSRLGVAGFDFVNNPADWPIVKKYGLVVSMYRLDFAGGQRGGGGRGAPGPPGWNAINRKEATGAYLTALHAGIDEAAANAVPNIILLSGTRKPLTDEEGADNAVAFCNQVKAHAEDKGVTLCMELINSTGQQGPVDYMFDHFGWGRDVVSRVNSPRVKILYDIYHAQLMEGNIVQTIRDNIHWIGHFHTGGVPGRRELDGTQELNYRFIAQAIADLNFSGYITHEWTPTPGNDPMVSLQRVMEIINGSTS
jgi:hydroxypyruvate isomerase